MDEAATDTTKGFRASQSQERADRIARRFDMPMVVAALLVIPDSVTVDCAEAAASYSVQYADGRPSETWNTWFHISGSGNWFPSATAQEVSTNGLAGLPDCNSVVTPAVTNATASASG